MTMQYAARSTQHSARSISGAARGTVFFVLCVLGVLAPPAPAQTRTTIRDVLYSATGTRVSGQVEISWDAFTSADGKALAAGKVTKKITDGVLEVQLVPNVGAIPAGTSYAANYALTGGTNYLETWVVPPSGTVVTLSAVRVSVPPVRDISIAQQQLTLGSGLTTQLGLYRSATPPVATAAGQMYCDTSTTPCTPMISTGAGTTYSAIGSGGSTPDADASTKGKLQLAGDLGGTAAAPTVPGLAGKVSLTGSYADPDWIASLAASKLSGTLWAADGSGNVSSPGTIYHGPTGNTFIESFRSFSPNMFGSTGGVGVMGVAEGPWAAGLYGAANASVATGDGVYGFNGDAYASHAAGTVGNVVGGTQYAANTSTGTVTNLIASFLWSPVNSGGGTVTNAYGMKVADVTVGGTNHAIYTGLGQVHFGDDVDLGAGQTITAPGGLIGPVAAVGTAALTAQSASIGATTLFTAPAVPIGLYQICYDSRITQAATSSSSLQVTIGWDNGSGGAARSKADIAITSNTLGDGNNACWAVHVGPTTGTITYAVTYASSGATAMQYALDVRVVSVGQ